MSVNRQLSLFGADAADPEPGDLAGVLLAGGEIVARGSTAQVSVSVDHPWRAAALIVDYARRGLAAASMATVDRHILVRTAYSPLLAPLAEVWTSDPARWRLRLDGRLLRLWLIAAGSPATGAFVLPLGSPDERDVAGVGAGLAGLGLGAQYAVARGVARGTYRIVGRRRLARLAELVGDRPKPAPVDSWPS